MKLLIWDFDGTLGFQKRGYFSESIARVIREIDPETSITVEQIRPYLRAGFPWHSPEQPHLDISTADQWWERLYPIFQRAFEAAGFDSGIIIMNPQEGARCYTAPGELVVVRGCASSVAASGEPGMK